MVHSGGADRDAEATRNLRWRSAGRHVSKEPPRGVRLTGGQQCVEAVGALDDFNGKVARYFRDDKTTYLLDELYRSTPRWTFHIAHHDSTCTTGPDVTVTTAWFPADPG